MMARKAEQPSDRNCLSFLGDYLDIRNSVSEAGYQGEYDWSESLRAVESAETFALEACWVVLNAGMKEQVARTIWKRLRPQLNSGTPLVGFRHLGKCRAVRFIWSNRNRLFAQWDSAGRTVDWLQSLPWIGKITKWHLAKNLGVNCCKPDRHLVRLAESTGETPAALCERLSKLSGDRIATVDVVLWRAANLGLIGPRRLEQKVLF